MRPAQLSAEFGAELVFEIAPALLRALLGPFVRELVLTALADDHELLPSVVELTDASKHVVLVQLVGKVRALELA